MGTELDFQRVLLKEESDPDDTGVRLDNLDGCLWLAYKTLVWMDDEDPGGAVFSQRMLSQKAELVVDNMVRELMLSSCEPPLELDPEYVLQNHPQLLRDDWSQSSSTLCRSFDEHLRCVSEFAYAEPLGCRWQCVDDAPPSTGQEPIRNSWLEDQLKHRTEFTREEWDEFGFKGLRKDDFVKSNHVYYIPAEVQQSSWVKLYRQDQYQQVVTTHYEIIRGLALALALVDYHHKATCDGRLDDEAYERIRKKLDDEVLPLLSSYHMLMWSARRPLLDSANAAQSSQPEWLQLPNTHKTLLSLCTEAESVHDAAGELIWEAFRALRAFRVLRREAAEDETLKAQWKVLLMLCDHPKTSSSGDDDSGHMMLLGATSSSSWWYQTILVAFVRGYSCLHLSRWKEATTQFASVLRASRTLIAGGDIAEGRALDPSHPSHPLITLQKELANKYEAPRGQLRRSMRMLTANTEWGDAINNMLDYFVLLHHYLGSKGLIHSLLKLLVDRAGLGGQRDWQDAGAEGNLKDGVESFCTLMHLAMETLHDLQARLDSIEGEYQKQGNQNHADCLCAVDCFRYLIAAAEHYLRVSWLTMYTDCGLLDEAYDLIAENIARCSDDDISKVRREVLKEGFDEYADVEQWLESYSAMDVEMYNYNFKPISCAAIPSLIAAIPLTPCCVSDAIARNGSSRHITCAMHSMWRGATTALQAM